MSNWKPGQGTIDTMYPSNTKMREDRAKVDVAREPGWNKEIIDPRIIEAYESCLPPEQKARLIEIREKEFEQRKARYARGEGSISEIMYPSMSPLSKTEIKEVVEEIEQTKEREELIAKHYAGDLLYQSMHHNLTVDADGKLVAVKEDVKE